MFDAHQRATVEGSIWRSFGVAALALGTFLSLSGLAVAADATTQPVTFAKDIAPIFQEKCQDCHRKGGMAPMSLVTYEEARPWARSVKERVIARQMPPWHLDKTVGVQHFNGDMSLSDAQISMIARWVDSGAPMGNPQDMPTAKTWPSDTEWQLAKEFGRPPDMIVKSDDYTMPAVNQDQWWKPITDLHVTEPVWVRAVEMRPGTPAGRKITHHALAHLMQDDPDARKFSDFPDSAGAAGANEAGTLMEWAVGKNYDIYRPNTGKLLLPGSKIWWDIHYHAVGEDHRSRGAGHLALREERDAEVSDLSDGIRLRFEPGLQDRHSTKQRDFDPGLPRAEVRREAREFPAAHAPARQGHVDRGDPAGWHHADDQLRRPLQLQLDDELYLRG